MGALQTYKSNLVQSRAHPIAHQIAAFCGLGATTFYGLDGGRYFTRVRISPRWNSGQFCLHIFYRPDLDRYLHTHRWGFWTIPLTCSYTERYLDDGRVKSRVVRPFRLAKRAPNFVHTIECFHGKVAITLIRRAPDDGEWGFLVPEFDWHIYGMAPANDEIIMVDGERTAIVHWKTYYDVAEGKVSFGRPEKKVAA